MYNIFKSRILTYTNACTYGIFIIDRENTGNMIQSLYKTQLRYNALYHVDVWLNWLILNN